MGKNHRLAFVALAFMTLVLPETDIEASRKSSRVGKARRSKPTPVRSPKGMVKGESGLIRLAGRGAASPVRRLFLAGQPSIPKASEYPISAQHYQSIRKTAVAILRAYAPRDHYFVGLGRSPPELVEFFENLGGREFVTNIPMTGLQGAFDIPQERYALYFEHFEAFIPRGIISEQRDIVLVDSWGSGGTLFAVQKMLTAYLVTQGSKAQVKIAGFSRTGVTETERSRLPDVPYKIFEQAEHGSALIYGRKIARYQNEHFIEEGSGLADLRLNPSARLFREQLREHMSRDARLDVLLHKEFGVDKSPN